jgi:hypothetical protein
MGEQKAAGFSFPDVIAGLQFKSKRDFEAEYPGLGSSLRYEGEGMWADVFIYDLQKPAIQDGIKSDLIAGVFEETAAEVTTFQDYKDVKVVVARAMMAERSRS